MQGQSNVYSKISLFFWKSLVLTQNYRFSALAKSRNYSAIFPHNKTKQVVLVIDLIYNLKMGNCGHYDFCKLWHNKKIFCRLGQNWILRLLTALKIVKYCMRGKFCSRDQKHLKCSSNLVKILPQI